ncbi:MAG: DUF362 domain-containing protein, partial [Acidobacteriaceae bacterium]|nr:DUF362 domain-containing protein [Acidobacteriaceae bacterium]
DLSINVAKMKTHKFSGVTLCLKNAIGICNGKEFMPHRRPGPPCEGGDSFPSPPSLKYRWRVRRARVLSSIVGRHVAAWSIAAIRRLVPRPLPHLRPWEPLFGDWSGNDTIWRTTVDLNRIWLRSKSAGNDSRLGEGKMLCLIDGVLGMDHEGPMTGMPVNSQVLVMAKDPVAADTLGARLMGFDPRKIPTIQRAAQLHDPSLGLPLSEDAIHGNVPIEQARTSYFPCRGWVAALRDGCDPQTPHCDAKEAHACKSA